MFQVQGQIDISPPLTWAEVQPTGFMVMSNGVPQVPAGRFVQLVPTENLVDNPEGTLHRFTFASLTAGDPQILGVDRETFRAQIAQTIAAFPTHTFGTPSRVIRFRGDLIDDQWRVGVAPDGVTVRRQTASITWVDA